MPLFLVLILYPALLTNGLHQDDSLLFLEIVSVAVLIIFLATLNSLRTHLERVHQLSESGVETIARIESIQYNRYITLRYQYIWAGTLFHQKQELSLFTQAYELLKVIEKKRLYIKVLLDPNAPDIAIIPSLYRSVGKLSLELVDPVDFETEFAFASIHHSTKHR